MDKINHFSENDRLIDLGLSTRAYNYCLTHGITTAKQLIHYYKVNNKTIPAGRNAGFTTISELTQKCKDILLSIEYNQATTVKYGTIGSWGLSVRAYNVLQKHRLITKQALLKFYYDHKKSLSNSLNHCGPVTTREIEDLCVFLIASGKDGTASTISNNPQPSVQTHRSAETISIPGNLRRLVNKYPKILSFKDKDLIFLSSYKEKNGHYPLLWILSRYIRNDRDLLCFAHVYGIDTRLEIKSPAQLAQENGVSKTCIYIRISKGQNKLFGPHSDFKEFIKSNDIDYLKSCIEPLDFVSSSEKNDTLVNLNTQEGSTFTIGFLLKLLAVISRGYTTIGDFIGNKPNPDIFVLSKDLFKIFHFDTFFSEFDYLVENATKKFDLNLRELIEDSPSWSHFSVANVNRVLNIVKAYALSKHGLYEENKVDVVTILPKRCDLSSIVYNIVSESKNPLTVQEIVTIASNQYPFFTFSEDAIKITLRQDTRIQHKRAGNMPTRYLLASSNAPTSIRDAIVKILSDSDTPVLLDDIVNYVLIHFPSSSKSSIRTSILSDSKKRFVQFEGGLFGLTSRTYPDEYVTVTDNTRFSFAERLILLKKFFDENHRFPFIDSNDPQEVDFAKWIDRNRNRTEVKTLIDTYAFDIWKSECESCESYIIAHKGRVPQKNKEPRLYKWLFDATMDLSKDLLSQEQRRLLLHLFMQIRH